jgi:uncharacterized membrane protein YsdA (DUF1294 family)
MGVRANPVLYTLLPALVAAFALHLLLSHEVRVDALWTWLLAINLVVLPLWLLDKVQAKRNNAFRVPEKTLHLVAAAGGAPMSLGAMHLLRHKTQHKWFKWIYLGLLVPWGAVVFFWLSRP